ncbi:MAG: phosphonate ABC transporter, permease protein PhnE [Anaerolineales bacterium]|nr:phosphonate ABC transporter, permease protein PhnE [Anaerolineales bacterium]
MKANAGKDTGQRPRAVWIAALLSLILPGLGQAWAGRRPRGAGVFALVASSLAIAAWYRQPAWYLVPAGLWLWNVWDAWHTPASAPIGLAVIAWLAMVYLIGWQVTEISFVELFTNRERASSILKPMLRPDFFTQRVKSEAYWVEVQVPCTAEPPKAENTLNGVHISAFPDCAALGETLMITAEGLRPNYPTEVTWVTPTGGVLLLGENYTKMLTQESSSEGTFSAMIRVPPGSMSINDPTLIHRVYLTQREVLPGIAISTNGRYVIQGIYETLALAWLATTLGALLALPMGFLAARNLMSGNAVTMGIYFVVRTLLNLFRSIESLILAIIFVVIVGLGPFPGMLALTIHTTAALGKLYSEVIEGIDLGPIEAVRAIGANWLQVVRYAVIPQIVPPFTALTIYRWDINVRSSTIIGFVGGGGIGFFLWQWIVLGDYRAVSTSFIAIAVVVILLDFFSAKLRERIG